MLYMYSSPEKDQFKEIIERKYRHDIEASVGTGSLKLDI